MARLGQPREIGSDSRFVRLLEPRWRSRIERDAWRRNCTSASLMLPCVAASRSRRPTDPNPGVRKAINQSRNKACSFMPRVYARPENNNGAG
jgi:hypothetical protein